jgi:hypothetical protein
MFDLTALQPALVGFFIVAGVAIALAVAALVTLATESRRRPTTGVVAINAAHPAAAAATRRAA